LFWLYEIDGRSVIENKIVLVSERIATIAKKRIYFLHH